MTEAIFSGQPTTGQRAVGHFSARPADYDSEIIRVQLSENAWVIDVEQLATCQLTIINGGERVDTFQVTVQGLDEEWVQLSHYYINLNERARATISLSLSPPRAPSSLAGPHHFALIVTSDNHPDQFAQRGATLTINPYYEFAIGELSPRRQTISWRRHFGRVLLPIANLGNGQAHFRLEGRDDEHASSYEFDVPGEPVALAQQAEVRLAPEERITVPIEVTPRGRRLIGIRKRTYPFTITTALLDQQQSPRSMLGELKSAPLIGIWWILLVALLLIIFALFLLKPRIYTFMLTEGGVASVISNSTPVALRWDGPFTTNLTLDPPPEGLEQPLPSRGTVVAVPTGDTNYTLRGDNFLSRFAPSIFPPPTRLIEVDLNAIPPRITFEAEPHEIIGEGEVTLRWAVEQADKIEIFRSVGEGGALEPVGEGDFSDQPIGALVVTPEPNQPSTTYILVASNQYAPTPTPDSERVSLVTPTPTIPPTPNLIFFSGNPLIINEGEESVLSWQVVGVEQVTLQDPINTQSVQPAAHNLMVRPTASGDYLLIPGGGAQPMTVRINVTPAPTATPVPNAPVIVDFSISPDTIVEGFAEDITLTWLVTGDTTSIEMSGPDIGVISGLDPQGTLVTSADQATLFTLTASNGDLKTSGTKPLKSNKPTETPVPPTPVPPPPPPTLTPTPTATPTPPVIALFQAEGDEVTRKGDDQFDVIAGAKVKLVWNVLHSDKVSVVGPVSSDNQPAQQDNYDLGRVSDEANYELMAQNSNGFNKVSRSIRLTILPRPAPDPPTNFVGQVVSTDTIKLTWEYDINKYDEIIGFRIYRADLTAGEPFKPWKSLNLQTPPEFVIGVEDDTITNGTCGKGYYVVALYTDLITDKTKETDSAIKSWYSPTC